MKKYIKIILITILVFVTILILVPKPIGYQGGDPPEISFNKECLGFTFIGERPGSDSSAAIYCIGITY